ncbi:hypothetical protein [Paracoccus xiamenensis]|uniref:hypothetical protein n=1 Tax=Paracoccus xiamenensis TaxID=2714901 RepID=UPI00140BF9F4|nr:hypothetical protein [Paracoccus xiamenensis]NHF73152.1 hypothetical protein [Paracoccus xiamenensis]
MPVHADSNSQICQNMEAALRKSAKELEQLARLAQIRSDAELKRFAAFRAHVDAATTQRQQMRQKLAYIYESEAAFSIAEARLANQEAGQLGHGISQLDRDLERLRPGFDTARQRAILEFGRVQVLKALAGKLHDKSDLDRNT